MPITITFDTLADFQSFAVVVANNPGLSAKLDTVIGFFGVIQQQESTIMADLSQLTTDVASNGTVIDSAITLLQGLSAALAAAGTNPAQLAALQQQLEAETTNLANAVAANTPAAPPPAPAPAPPPAGP
jgi:hypothetical protein